MRHMDLGMSCHLSRGQCALLLEVTVEQSVGVGTPSRDGAQKKKTDALQQR